MKTEERFADQENAFRQMMESHQAGLQTALPCLVEAVDFVKQTVSAQPTIRATVTLPDGTTEEQTLPLLVDVPICFPRAGGFALTFPIAVGDECLVVFASRCIDSWWQSGTIESQAEKRMHDLSDGFCLLAPTSQPKVLPSVHSANVQLRNEEGDRYFEIQPNGTTQFKTPEARFEIHSSGDMNVVTTVGDISVFSFSGDIDIQTIQGAININAPIINLTGIVNLTGTLISTGEITAIGKTVSAHTHAQPNDTGGSGEEETNPPS
jgi:hypothetical protein